MTRWAIAQVRHALYEPLELLCELGIDPPEWVVLAVVAIDKPLVRCLMRSMEAT